MVKLLKKQYLPMQKGDVPQTWACTKELEKKGYRSEINMTEGIRNFILWFKNYYK